MTKLKPCPFCGAQLIKKRQDYIAVGGCRVQYDYWEHPLNGCVLEERASEMNSLLENDIERWNRRTNNESVN